MEEHIDSIRTYLPVEFKHQETNEYITYLVDAYLENLPTEKFQFSFTAFHMLYMSYIYKTKWLLKTQGNRKMEEALTNYIAGNKSKNIEFNSLYDFSLMEEKTSLEKLLKSLNFHNNDVDLCKKLVEVRNICVHASGKIYFNRAQQIENYVLEELESIKAIHKAIKTELKSIFEKFISDTWNTKWIEVDIKEWILKNYLSQKELEEILQIKPVFLKQNSDSREILFKKLIYTAFISEAVKYVPDKKDYFINALIALMKGLSPQIDVRINPDDSEKLKNTQEIIEEMILPSLTGISNEEAMKAQKILKFS